MALKVKAVERLLKFDKNDPGSYRYVLKPELYTSLDQKKVIREVASLVISTKMHGDRDY